MFDYKQYEYENREAIRQLVCNCGALLGKPCYNYESRPRNRAHSSRVVAYIALNPESYGAFLEECFERSHEQVDIHSWD